MTNSPPTTADRGAILRRCWSPRLSGRHRVIRAVQWNSEACHRRPHADKDMPPKPDQSDNCYASQIRNVSDNKRCSAMTCTAESSRMSFFSSFLSSGWVVIAALMTGGCVALPRQMVGHQGQFPPPGTFVIGGVEPGVRPPAFAADISQILEARGFSSTDRARYLVQIAQSDRPANMEMSVPGAGASGVEILPKKGNSVPRRGKRVRQLTLSIGSASDGQELYRLQGSEVYRPGKADDGGVRLAGAMMAHIGGQ